MYLPVAVLSVSHFPPQNQIVFLLRLYIVVEGVTNQQVMLPKEVALHMYHIQKTSSLNVTTEAQLGGPKVAFLWLVMMV